ncbi:prevent-host-death family protein [Caldicellulosiruptor saccharolyticus DSM 8903]|uniref:Antitoxin n=1 Tax=Caldicellulosiruptor saccharolyticus (strain ATCC 43494 / DSM 8903 / Tp8T 6331) TaxID=351627 RepID=A4XLQ0_CALS8|nr:type II toxin-antitoxin system prevent-host-death family antitoxin [Caldicellulosiruptor saccharolyticus]ABP67835.1 prevent-host-death family protein [Caldicellulosiruptor saccharolyticus DSM 8903]
MIVNATEFKMRVGKYLKLAEKEEIITKNGRKVAKLTPIRKSDTSAVDFLYGLLENYGNKEIDVKQIRNERLKKHEGVN